MIGQMLRAAMKRLSSSKERTIICIVLLFGLFLIWPINSLFHCDTLIDRLSHIFIAAAITILIAGILLFILFDVPAILHAYRCLDTIGFHNDIDSTPILFFRNRHTKQIELWFYSPGIELNYWIAHLSQLENAFNITISSITTGDTYDTIHIHAFDGKYNWHQPIIWTHALRDRNDELVLGMSPSGLVSLDLNVYPHVLIGGATGSGKTILLKHLLQQCHDSGDYIYLFDFKGGIDYSNSIFIRCQLITSETSAMCALNSVMEELYHRRDLFLASGCVSIVEFNLANPPLPRIILAVDEVAELLDTTGLGKSEKEVVKQIEQSIRSIARLGRAFGIHLFLSTQRGDADILAGQIKANLTYRICGRADNMLSVITLDNGDAATMVPKDIPGVFINQDGLMFKGFLLP